jgi:hypothetical protein
MMHIKFAIHGLHYSNFASRLSLAAGEARLRQFRGRCFAWLRRSIFGSTQIWMLKRSKSRPCRNRRLKTAGRGFESEMPLPVAYTMRREKKSPGVSHNPSG